MTTPYTYHLYLPITNEHYYGASYKKGCHPNDLWTTYFSSSKVVMNRIKKYGKDLFEYEVRKTFETREEALLWESQVLKRLHVASRKDWMNITENGPLFCTPEELTIRWRNKIKISMNTPEMKTYIGLKTKEQFSDPVKRENFRLARLGDKNPAHGTIWIHNGTQHKRVVANIVNTYIEIGWSEGRIFSNAHNVSLQLDFSTRNLDPITHRILKGKLN